MLAFVKLAHDMTYMLTFCSWGELLEWRHDCRWGRKPTASKLTHQGWCEPAACVLHCASTLQQHVWYNIGILKLLYQSDSRSHCCVLRKCIKRHNLSHKKNRATRDEERKPVLAHRAGSASFLYRFSFFLKNSQTYTQDQSAGICAAK